MQEHRNAKLYHLPWRLQLLSLPEVFPGERRRNCSRVSRFDRNCCCDGQVRASLMVLIMWYHVRLAEIVYNTLQYHLLRSTLTGESLVTIPVTNTGSPL